MDNRYRKPANLNNLPESMRWVEAIPDADALERGMRTLDKLKRALPPDRAGAVDDAKVMLAHAASMYEKVHSSSETAGGGEALMSLLPPEKKRALRRICARLLDGLSE